ncbi:MAG: hypothetical protein ABIR16_05920, partial [Dokdonella sp.]
VLLDAGNSIDDVESDPVPEALPWDLAASYVAIRARWWIDSRRSDLVRVQSKVVLAIKLALDNAGIDMSQGTQVQLFHDQSESGDGEHGVPREGWKKHSNKTTEPRWKVQARDNGRASDSGRERSGESAADQSDEGNAKRD